MAQVTIDVPIGLSIDVAKQIATNALQARATTGRVEAVLSRSETSVGPGLLAQVALHDQAWREIDKEWGLLSAEDVTVATGGNRGNISTHTSNLRRRKRLAGVKRDGALVYPAFQFASRGAGKMEVARAWTALVEALAPAQWEAPDILIWAASPNAWLQGDKPADEVRQKPNAPTERLLMAAHKALPDGVRGIHVA